MKYTYFDWQTNGNSTLEDILETKRMEPTIQGSTSVKSGLI